MVQGSKGQPESAVADEDGSLKRPTDQEPRQSRDSASPAHAGRGQTNGPEDEEPEVGGVELEAMKAGLKRIYGKHYPLPKWAAFRHRMILMEIAKLERQLEKGTAEVKK